MQTGVTIKTIFHCSLERAYKTPILCDVSKVHTGFAGLMPRVTHCTDDQNWGRAGYAKKIFVAKSLTQKGGLAFLDKVIERVENKYWILELSDFKFPMFGFSRFVGEWSTTEIGPDAILITYTYTLYADITLLYPMYWLFTQILWRAYMKRVTENIRQLAYHKEPYLYD